MLVLPMLQREGLTFSMLRTESILPNDYFYLMVPYGSSGSLVELESQCARDLDSDRAACTNNRRNMPKTG